MTKQPEALRLAERLEDYVKYYDDAPKAAAELRRLHEAHDWQYRMAGERLGRIEKAEARITTLEAALEQALEALVWEAEGWEDVPPITRDAITALRAAIEQRQWQGLTDEERRGLPEWQKIQNELGPVWAPMMLYLYEAIEAKLKERNS